MSVSLLLDMASAATGDRLALGPRAEGLTFAEMADRVPRLMGAIADADPSHVAMLARNGPHFPQLIFAAAGAGVPFVPLNYRLSAETLNGLLKDLPRPLLLIERDLESSFAGVLEDQSRVRTLEEFFANARDRDPRVAVPVGDDEPALLLYTSGTTSKPKAVVLTHANLLSYILSTVDLGSAEETEASLVTVPPYHIAGVGSALSNLYAGRRVVHLPDFDPHAWLQIVRDEAITSAMLVPTMLARVVDALGDRTAEVPGLNLIAYGGAKTPRPILERALAAFPGTGFCNAYGLTETSSTLALLGPDDHRAALASADEEIRARLGSVGLPVPGIEVEIRNADGEILGPHETGELYVRGPQVSGTYAGRGSVLDPNGWFPTRDLAYRDAGGYIFINGRADDTIIRGGENISPAEIEEVLYEHPDVRDAVVIGLQDQEWGQKLLAVIVGRAGGPQDSEGIRQFVRARLRGSRTPDEVVWVDELPVTATGKIVRRDLVAQFSTPTPKEPSLP